MIKKSRDTRDSACSSAAWRSPSPHPPRRSRRPRRGACPSWWLRWQWATRRSGARGRAGGRSSDCENERRCGRNCLRGRNAMGRHGGERWDEVDQRQRQRQRQSQIQIQVQENSLRPRSRSGPLHPPPRTLTRCCPLRAEPAPETTGSPFAVPRADPWPRLKKGGRLRDRTRTRTGKGESKMGTTGWGMLAARRALDEWHWQVDRCECDVWTLHGGSPRPSSLSLSFGEKRRRVSGVSNSLRADPSVRTENLL